MTGNEHVRVFEKSPAPDDVSGSNHGPFAKIDPVTSERFFERSRFYDVDCINP